MTTAKPPLGRLIPIPNDAFWAADANSRRMTNWPVRGDAINTYAAGEPQPGALVGLRLVSQPAPSR